MGLGPEAADEAEQQQVGVLRPGAGSPGGSVRQDAGAGRASPLGGEAKRGVKSSSRDWPPAGDRERSDLRQTGDRRGDHSPQRGQGGESASLRWTGGLFRPRGQPSRERCQGDRPSRARGVRSVSRGRRRRQPGGATNGTRRAGYREGLSNLRTWPLPPAGAGGRIASWLWAGGLCCPRAQPSR